MIGIDFRRKEKSFTFQKFERNFEKPVMNFTAVNGKWYRLYVIVDSKLHER
jgi:hypothetical protein